MRKYDDKVLADQLRCPNGTLGEKTAENMFRVNKNMIRETIDIVDIRPQNRILEIGFGNGKHLPYLMDQAAGITYIGLDTSPLMAAQARIYNSRIEREGLVRFMWVSGSASLDFQDNYFDLAFAINILYFWQHPVKYLREVNRVLKPGGRIALAYVSECFARTLPFTQHGFELYSPKEVEHLCLRAGFIRINHLQYTEKTINSNGKKVLRPFVITTAVK